MLSRLTRSFLAGSALLLGAALVAAGASTIDDDVPDRGEQVEILAAELALELQRLCPPASPSDQAAFDRCRRDLFGDSARNLSPRLLWGRRHQDAGAALKDTNLTQFAPDVIAGLYLPLFMFSGEHSAEYVDREGMYLIRLRAGFRNRLPPGQFPYPFWHDEAKWGVYQAANSVLLWVDPKTAKIVIGQFSERGSGLNSMADGCGRIARGAFSRELRCSMVCSGKTIRTCQSSIPLTEQWLCGCATLSATTVTCLIIPCPCAGWS
jgi:hypothetical protein